MSDHHTSSSGVVSRYQRDTGRRRRFSIAWRNDFVSFNVGMKRRVFPLGPEALGHVHRVSVERALVFVRTANSLIHERALLQLTVNGQRNEVVILSDPQISGGTASFDTCSCVLPASGDLGVGSFAFIYQAPSGPVPVLDRSDCGGISLSDLDIKLDFPLYPSLADSEILQCIVTLVLE